MAELIHEHSAVVRTPAGEIYVPRTFAEQQPDGIWFGWLEFQPLKKGPVLKTARETSQPSRAAVEYWATGLEAVYFEGAFARAEVVSTR